tara:strand:+ start:2219 stop:2824 length:606 start_codon:yes stop_codon:yes gene_type:complete
MEIVFATKNEGKLEEFKHLIKGMDIYVLSLNDIEFNGEIPEEATTYLENALIKAREVSMFSNRIAMSDDSGIEILAYNNGPGVRSARFLPELTYEQKNKKIIADLEETSGHQRAAKYKCAIAIYTPGGKSFLCEGECDGVISTDLKGDGGFGYDPIFFLPEYGKTFAELPAKIKNQISHRAKAFKKAKKILSGLKNANTTK